MEGYHEQTDGVASLLEAAMTAEVECMEKAGDREGRIIAWQRLRCLKEFQLHLNGDDSCEDIHREPPSEFDDDSPF